MSEYTNVTVTHGSTTIATDASADITEDAEDGKLWGTGQAKLVQGSSYLLSAGGLLDWTGQFTGQGKGTAASPYTLTVDDGTRRARHQKK
jgi:hypothetical protein